MNRKTYHLVVTAPEGVFDNSKHAGHAYQQAFDHYWDTLPTATHSVELATERKEPSSRTTDG